MCVGVVSRKFKNPQHDCCSKAPRDSMESDIILICFLSKVDIIIFSSISEQSHYVVSRNMCMCPQKTLQNISSSYHNLFTLKCIYNSASNDPYSSTNKMSLAYCCLNTNLEKWLLLLYCTLVVSGYCMFELQMLIQILFISISSYFVILWGPFLKRTPDCSMINFSHPRDYTSKCERFNLTSNGSDI